MLRKFDLELERVGLKFAKGEEATFEGYLSVWDSVDSYGDTVRKGAFELTLEDRKRAPPMLLNHDRWSSLPVGIWKSMEEDDVGLRVVGEMTPGNRLAEDVYASMKHGAISGLSIGYRAMKYKANDSGGLDLLQIHLIEGSIVTVPAEDDARIDVVKAALDECESITDCEHFLRDVGMSRKGAKQFLARFKEVALRDAGGSANEVVELREKLAATELRLARGERLERIQRLI
jgi:HK97 family phage prohead protease